MDLGLTLTQRHHVLNNHIHKDPISKDDHLLGSWVDMNVGGGALVNLLGWRGDGVMQATEWQGHQAGGGGAQVLLPAGPPPWAPVSTSV